MDGDASLEEPTDSIDLVDDGTVVLQMSGRTFVFRRPTVAEFSVLSDTAQESAAIYAQYRVGAAIVEEYGVVEGGAVRRMTSWDELRPSATSHIAWLREAIVSLVDPSFDLADEDFPAWVISFEPLDLIDHWRSRPTPAWNGLFEGLPNVIRSTREELAIIYGVAAPLGIAPCEIDRCELWQVAAMFPGGFVESESDGEA